MPPEPPVLATDDLIGSRYRLSRRIARGGMAEVWEAEDTILARPVAVKALLPHLAADEALLARFRREAVAAARLSHPHIVSIYDTCTSDDCEAIVMELVRGDTLRDVLDHSGPLPVRRSVDIAAQVADALDHAHRAGLIHRDVKPGNILLSHDGRVLVADFGIAKAIEGVSDLTDAGQVVGTAKYLSPEQVQGSPVDARSDVFALGVVLYEMVCGRPPFAGDTSTSTALARLTTVPLRPRQVRAGIPRRLDDVVMRALARQPEARFQTAAELRRALLDIDLSRHDDPSDGTSLLPAPDDTDDQPTGFAASERSWLVPAAFIIVVALTLGVVGALLGRTSVGENILDAVRPGTDSSGQAVTIADAHSFDPEGSDRTENEARTRLAVDGDQATSWTTDTYKRRELGGLKNGVGLVLTAAATAEFRELRITSPTRGWRAEVFVSDDDPSTLAGWGEPVDQVVGTAQTVIAKLGGREGRAVLLWVTDLGDCARGCKLELTEAQLTA